MSPLIFLSESHQAFSVRVSSNHRFFCVPWCPSTFFSTTFFLKTTLFLQINGVSFSGDTFTTEKVTFSSGILPSDFFNGKGQGLSLEGKEVFWSVVFERCRDTTCVRDRGVEPIPHVCAIPPVTERRVKSTTCKNELCDLQVSCS